MHLNASPPLPYFKNRTTHPADRYRAAASAWPGILESSPAEHSLPPPGAPAAVGNYTPVTRKNRVITAIWRHTMGAGPARFGESRNLLYCFYSLEREEMPETAGNQTLQNADVAQLVEHHLAKVDVASSNLVVRSQDTVMALIPEVDSRNRGLHGGLAERRGSGLQSRIHGFESRTHLGENPGYRFRPDHYGRLAQR